MVKLPRLVDPATGAEIRRLQPIRGSLTQKIVPLSYASLELLPEDSVPPRSFVEMYTESGSAGVFRAKAPQDGFGDLTVTCELEHAVTELGDSLVTAKLEQETTLHDAFVTLMTYYKGTHWQLPQSFAAPDAVVLQAEYVSVLEAMLSVLDQCPGYMMTFNFATHPWTLSLAARDATVTAEGRLSRNVRTARITRDDTELCTRLYMEGLPGTDTSGETTILGHLDADTIGTYGVVERTIERSSDWTDAQATRAANQYLAKHKRPAISVEIAGMDLAAVTGEAFDTLRLGKRYRIAVEGIAEPVEETITSLSWSNLWEAPRDVTVSLAEQEEAIISAIHRQNTMSSSSGTSARRSARNTKKEMETEFKREYAILDEQGNILQQAGLKLDAHGLLYYATDYENNLTAHIESTAGALDSVIRNIVDGHTTKFTQTDRQIGMVVGTTHGSDGDEYFIKTGQIVLAINDDNSTDAIIDADHVKISGNTTLNGAFTIDSGLLKVKMGAKIDGGLEVVENLYLSRSLGASMPTNLRYAVYDLKLVTNGATVTLQKQLNDPSDGAWKDVGSFSRVPTLTGAWSGSTYTASMKYGSTAVGTPVSSTVYLSIDGTPNPNATVYANVRYDSASDNTKQILTKGMTMYEDAVYKCVDLKVDGITKGTVSTAATYALGYRDGGPIDGTAGGRTQGVTALVHDFTIERYDGTTKVIQIDCSSIYSTARAGYSPGTYTKAAVSLQGSVGYTPTRRSIIPVKQSSKLTLVQVDSQAMILYQKIDTGGSTYYVPMSTSNCHWFRENEDEGTEYFQASPAQTFYSIPVSSKVYTEGTSYTASDSPYYTKS